MALKRHLTKAIKGEALPLFVLPKQTIPGASLYWLVRHWEGQFRILGLSAGSRIAVPAVPSAAFIAILIAAVRQNYTFCPLPLKDPENYLSYIDPTLYLPLTKDTVDSVGLPTSLPKKRRNTLPLYPEIKLILATSGTMGKPKLVAISEENLLAVLSSHFRPLSLRGRTLLSLLPWHHAFGLVLELLLGILAKATFVRPEEKVSDLDKALAFAINYHCDTLFSVPLILEKLFSIPSAKSWIFRLSGGLIGGATLSPKLAKLLEGSSLRIGYGQTEASPGITLGEVGKFKPNYIGLPVGCQVQVKDKKLYYYGKNLALGYFTEKGLQRFPQTWFDSQDYAEFRSDGFYFSGRAGDQIKTSNGLFFPAAFLESKIREKLNAQSIVVAHEEEGIKILVDTQRYSQDMVENLVHEFFPKIKVKVEYCPEHIFQKDFKGNILRKESHDAYQKLVSCYAVS